ncbi:TauD/TfdA dioxygenase family protein [Burkholderia guangdongensis]|uniref:TauD/TfdA dioxygenase family protein n=1 Tax=Burkholderia guangdongensis TaxID=1792500 RepID=UPI0015CBE125|nr:TauD/TfdA family dioxygenase [Burkholderia guangdongensis]
MPLHVTPQPASCGALIEGLDLNQPLADSQVDALRALWLEHQVLAFPGQSLTVDDIERFARTIGPFGVDPFFEAIPGHPHVAQVRREADERTPIFAESWHSDWSFLAQPPAATVLYGDIIPPTGGDTLFANQYAAWDALPADLKALLAGRQGVHSARRGYARDGAYGEKDAGRSMAIRYSDDALATQLHPIARVHPETGRTALYVSPGYTIGIDGIRDDEAAPILRELFVHQARPEFVYRHRWSQGMLVMWDNRCVIHAATGGYEGHRRLLHRITVADRTLG